MVTARSSRDECFFQGGLPAKRGTAENIPGSDGLRATVQSRDQSASIRGSGLRLGVKLEFSVRRRGEGLVANFLVVQDFDANHAPTAERL